MKRQSPTRKETFDYYSFLSKFVCSIRRTAGLSKNDEASYGMQFPSSVIFTFGIRRLGLRFSRTVKEKAQNCRF